MISSIILELKCTFASEARKSSSSSPPLKRGQFRQKIVTLTIAVFLLTLHVIQPRSQGSLLPALWSKRERDPGKHWSRGYGTKLILREKSFVSHCFCLVYSQRSRSDRNSKIDLLTLLQLVAVNLYLTRVIPSEILKSISVISRSPKLKLIKSSK